MKEKISIDKLREIVMTSIDTLTCYLTSLLESGTERSLKRAKLFSYWIKDYVGYQRMEDTFQPKSLLRYHRGDVIQVNFGYRVGSELGGMHYAVVLDRRNEQGSPVITIVPLGSQKDGFKEDRFRFVLNTGLYELVKTNANKLKSEIEREAESFSKKHDELSEDSKKRAEDFARKSHMRFTQMNSSIRSLEKLKNGSVVNVGQITTISKMRIANPKMKSDSFNGIRVSDEDLKHIDERMNKLFL